MSKTTLYVYSTLANSQSYQNYKNGGGDLPVPDGEPVFVAGGAGVPDKFLRTPRGVMTPITPDQLSYLRENFVFNLHEKNGYITVSEHSEDPEKVAAESLAPRDDSAPLVEADFAEGEAPVVNAAGDEDGAKQPVRTPPSNRRA